MTPKRSTTQPRGFGTRLNHAMRDLEKKENRRITNTEFAERLTKRLGGKKITHTHVNGWIKGSIPRVETVRAIADETGYDVGWLVYGPDLGETQ